MSPKQFLYYFLIFFTTMFGCRAVKPIVSNSNVSSSVVDYINLYKDIAISEMKRTGIPASITLAQGIIESGCGQSSLAREANNHFGIKCHNDWKGQTIKHNDNKRNECFRKYKRPEESFYDHSDFLRSGSRYNFLFNYNNCDYKAWAHGLRKAGYATNPDYANMLIRTIEENNLWNFDMSISLEKQKYRVRDSLNEVILLPSNNSTIEINTSIDKSTSIVVRAPRIMENNRIQYIVVKDGDTREEIENEFSLLKWELAKYNELKNDFQLVKGQILYIQPKRDKAEPGKEFYNAKEGDTMYLISQKYGIKLKKLYDMNRVGEGYEPEAGEKIWLRKIKPFN